MREGESCKTKQNIKFMLDVMAPNNCLRRPHASRSLPAANCVKNADAQFIWWMHLTWRIERHTMSTTTSEAINFNRQQSNANINYKFASKKSRRTDIEWGKKPHKTFTVSHELIETEKNFTHTKRSGFNWIFPSFPLMKTNKLSSNHLRERRVRWQ